MDLNDQSADLTAFITRNGAQLVTDTRAVALAFGKRHKNIVRIIDGMASSARPEIVEHRGLNFEPTMYTVPGPKGATRKEAMYLMTADGLTELAMSFTGDDARVVRIRFIAAFKAVADRLARADSTITERLHAFERRAIPSATKGKIGSRLMNERRKEKRGLDLEESLLRAESQPALAGLTPAPMLQAVGREASASNDSAAHKAA